MFPSYLTRLRTFSVLAFLVPLVLRAVPEILMGPYIVGFDTLGYYVPNVLMWLGEGVDFWRLIAVGPLLYLMLLGATSVGIPIVVSLKVLPPLIHGLLALAIFFYARNAFSWSPRKSLLVAFFATSYFVALRISWDMLRNELGLMFLFVALIFLQRNGDHWKHSLYLSLAMISVVLAHPLVAVVLLVIVAASSMRSHLEGKPSETRRLVVSSLPAVLSFSVMAFANYVVSSGFSFVSGFPEIESKGWLALFGFSSYLDMMVNNLGFLVFCYLPLLPLVILGARRFRSNLQIKAWISWILVAFFSALISPTAFIPGSYRWALMLSYPLAFYATEAIVNLRVNICQISIGLMLTTLAVGFLVLPNETPFPYYAMFPYHGPTSMLQNTVSLSDCQDTIEVLQWLADNMHDDVNLLAHDAFYGWSLLALDESRVVRIGYDDPERIALEIMQNASAKHLYLIWWTNGEGWHGQPLVPSSFKEVYESGRIAAYTYEPAIYHDLSDSN
ncbi:MAG: hypothetical protein JSW72_01585 [Candidatus Bathyarchaeota archaeon]|nr:MAG: hypothetical protein JSW72_01585 [Candidatus Bathyarchaeota archaeon]